MAAMPTDLFAVHDAILKLLGIDPKARQITEFTVHCSYDNAATITLKEMVLGTAEPVEQKFDIVPHVVKQADDSIAAHQRKLRERMAFPAFVVEHPKLTDDQLAALDKRMTEVFNGPNGMRHIILDRVMPQEVSAILQECPSVPLNACPDCHSTRIYQPLVGPAEPCKTCGGG